MQARADAELDVVLRHEIIEPQRQGRSGVERVHRVAESGKAGHWIEAFSMR
jgi:hypothetical protein